MQDMQNMQDKKRKDANYMNGNNLNLIHNT